MPTALLSVYHKEGIVEFATQLKELGWNLLASGGTCKTLNEAGLPCSDVAGLVGGGPILGHRVVTLSREIHAALLAQDTPEDNAELQRLNIPRIDLVCVDLYPLRAAIAAPACTVQSVVEKTDVGGPTLLRAAAKGGRIVICDPADRADLIQRLKENNLTPAMIRYLAAKAEAVVADYCLASATYHGLGDYEVVGNRSGSFAGMIGRRIRDCKYGENAWQAPAALYGTGSDDPLGLDKFRILAGDPSYNTFCDVDRLLQTITHIAAAFDTNTGSVPPIAVAAKHGNPCGAAWNPAQSKAIEGMVIGSPQAIFDGLVMTNFPIDAQLADMLLHHKCEAGRRLLDGIIAPDVSQDAIELLRRKDDRCKILTNPALDVIGAHSLDTTTRVRYVRGGFLQQPNYTYVPVLDPMKADSPLVIHGECRLLNDHWYNIMLAWAVGSTSNSNTITLVKDGYVIGNGVGQQDRVTAAELAINRAETSRHDTVGAIAYSDSFFPFTDGLLALIEAGIKLIFATSGSRKDQEVIDCCIGKGITLVMIPDTKARGFFGH